MFARITALAILITAWIIASPSRAADRPVYIDKPFRQEVSIRFRNDVDVSKYELRTVRADRDGKVLVNTDKGLLWTYENRLTPCNQYAALVDRDHRDLELLEGKFVFLTDNMLLPLHGAGIDYRHNIDGTILRATAAAPGHYLLLSKEKLVEVRNGETAETPNGGCDEIRHVPRTQRFLLLASDHIALYESGTARTSPKFNAPFALPFPSKTTPSPSPLPKDSTSSRQIKPSRSIPSPCPSTTSPVSTATAEARFG